MEAVALNPGRLVAAAVIGLVLLLVLIIKFKVQAMVAILIGAIAIGLLAGMPYEQIVTAVNDGIGNTLKGIALLVGLGSMFGAILEVSGGAQTLAVTMVKRFGDQKAAWALGITGLVIAMPVFFDAGLIILIPLAFSLAKRTKRSSLFYAIPLLAGLAVGHAFIPPTPGPILVANMLNVDLGWVIGVGIFCGIFAMIVAGPLWGSICGKKYMVPVPEHVANQADIDESKLPGFWTIVGIILIPLVLIILDSVAGVVPAMESVRPILGFLGEPFVALLIATVGRKALIYHAGAGKDHDKIPGAHRTDPSGDGLRRRTPLYAPVFRPWRYHRPGGILCKPSHCCGCLCGCSPGKDLCGLRHRCHDHGSRDHRGYAGDRGPVSLISGMYHGGHRRRSHRLLPL